MPHLLVLQYLTPKCMHVANVMLLVNLLIGPARPVSRCPPCQWGHPGVARIHGRVLLWARARNLMYMRMKETLGQSPSESAIAHPQSPGINWIPPFCLEKLPA